MTAARSLTVYFNLCAAVGVILLLSSLGLYYDNQATGKSFVFYAWPVGLTLLTLPSMLLLSTLRRRR